MDKNLKQLLQMDDPHLTQTERDKIFGHLQAEIAAHPLPSPLPWWKPMLVPVGSLCLLFVAASGALAMAAESTVPGDLLYPIKVQVTEPIRSALIVSPKNQALFEVKKTERRLEEVEKLVETKKINQEQVHAAESAVMAQTKKIEHLTQILESSSSKHEQDEVTQSLERTIETHTQRLEQQHERRLNRGEEDERESNLIAPIETHLQNEVVRLKEHHEQKKNLDEVQEIKTEHRLP